MRLQSKFFVVLALASIVPLLVVLGVVVSQNAKRLESQVQEEISLAVRQSIQDARAEVASDQAMVRALATVPVFEDFVRVMDGRDPLAYQQQADRTAAFMLAFQREQPGIQAIRVIDRDGINLLKSKEGSLVEPKLHLADGRAYVGNLADQPFFHWVRDNLKVGELGMSRFEMGQAGPEEDFCPPMIRYMIPLSVNGEVRAFLAVNTWGKRFDELFARIARRSKGQVFVAELDPRDARRDGVFLYHPDRRLRFGDQTGRNYRVQSVLGQTVWQQLGARSQGVISLPDRNERLFFQRFDPGGVGNPGWIVAVRVSRDILLAPVAEMQRSILLLAALLLVLSLVLSRWLAQQLADPIRLLAAKLKGYADGERDFPLELRRTDELGRLAQAFNYMVQRLDATAQERDRAEVLACQAAKLATVGELAAGLGHEINNPLNNMLALAKLMEREGAGQLPAWLQEDLVTMRRECERAADIIQGLLNFSRCMQPNYDEFSLQALLEEAVSLLRRKAQSAGVGLELQVAGDLRLRADRGQILQVLINVILNAIQACPSQGQVLIMAFEDPENLRVHVEDSGPGVPEELLPRIFDPFFSTKAQGQGTGLGLSVSFGIVKRHRGELWMDRSPVLGGARIKIQLPRAAQEAASQAVRNVTGLQEVFRHAG
ncbi:sensor histidine kinase [Thermithiobacillus plumbiphilus]|uniref:histidine kinase n=1 Tax=Thermithiobacillus plumbiphilus TaxID=1729899 RepID=A0ABU9DAW9_9PROT